MVLSRQHSQALPRSAAPSPAPLPRGPPRTLRIRSTARLRVQALHDLALPALPRLFSFITKLTSALGALHSSSFCLKPPPVSTGLDFPGFGLLSLAPPLRCPLTLGSKAFPSLQHDCITGFFAAQHFSLSKTIFLQMFVWLLITVPS